MIGQRMLHLVWYIYIKWDSFIEVNSSWINNAGDLAARNVLAKNEGTDYQAKVGDLGTGIKMIVDYFAGMCKSVEDLENPDTKSDSKFAKKWV